MITAKEMGKRKLERPFQPFRVVMKNGERFEIRKQTNYMPLHHEIHLPVEFENEIPKRGVFRHYEDIERIEPLEVTRRGVA